MRRFLFLLLLGLIGAACGRREEPSRFVLRLAATGPMAPFHPLISITLSSAAADLVADPLLVQEDTGVRSAVLQRWERVDQRHYRIQLKPGLRFSDGSLVQVDDVVASLDAGGLKVKASGDWLEVEPLIPGQTVEPAIYQQAIFKQTPLGYVSTGPFRVTEQTETSLVLERFQPLPRRINRVELLTFPTPRDVLARVIRGDANGAITLDERQLELLDGIPNLKPVRGLAPHSVLVVFNSHRLDGATRRQLAASLTLRGIAKALSESCLPVTAPPGQHQSGPPGPPYEILAPHFFVSMERAALALRRALGKRGGEIVKLNMEQALEREQRGQFDLILRPGLAWPREVLAQEWQSGSNENTSHYSNPRVDEAVARGDYAAVQAELTADPPFVEICRRQRIGVVDSRIKNPSFGHAGVLETLRDWEVEE